MDMFNYADTAKIDRTFLRRDLEVLFMVVCLLGQK